MTLTPPHAALGAALIAAAGHAPAAQPDPSAHTPPVRSAGVIGHLYLNPATGQAVFTPAAEYLAARQSPLRSHGDDITSDGLPDYWVAANEDPCGFGTPSSPSGPALALLDEAPALVGDHHLYKAQIAASDLSIGSVGFTFWTNLQDTDTDSNGFPDGNTAAHGLELTFWDREDAPHTGPGPTPPSSRSLTARYEVTSLPGTIAALPPGYALGYYLTLDLSDPSLRFELADTDGVGPANGNFTPFAGADLDLDTIADDDHDANGTHDWSYSFRAIQPTDGRDALIAYALAAPGISGTPNLGNPADGVIDLIDDASLTYIRADSVLPPMGLGIPLTTVVVPGIDGLVGRYSHFDAAFAQDPDPAGPSSGASSGDLFTHGPDFHCSEPNPGPYTLGYLILSASPQGCCPCDTDCSGALNLDDIDGFVAGFLAQTPPGDCDANGSWNVDDIDCFVACFTGGCG